MEGKTSEGKKIKPKYKNKPYALKKKKLNPKPGMGTPDLYLSGDFHGSFFLKNKSGNFEYGAKAKHSKYIIPKYPKIFGLEPKNKKVWIKKEATELYVEKIRAQLQI
jgi:hypothetical protein